MVALLRNRLCCCHTASKSANALWTPVACGLACVVYSGSPFYWFIGFWFVNQLLIQQSFENHEIYWCKMDQHSAKSIAQSQKQRCIQTESLLPADNWWERRGLQGCAFDFVRGCSDTVTSAWAQWEVRTLKTKPSTAKWALQPTLRDVESLGFTDTDSKLYWGRTQSSGWQTGWIPTMALQDSLTGFPCISMVYHGLPSSWNPMLSSNSTSTDGHSRGMLWTGQRIQLHTLECELGSRLAYEVDRSGIRFQNSQNSHWLYALEILMLVHVIICHPFCCLNQIQQVLKTSKHLNEHYRSL